MYKHLNLPDKIIYEFSVTNLVSLLCSFGSEIRSQTALPNKSSKIYAGLKEYMKMVMHSV